MNKMSQKRLEFGARLSAYTLLAVTLGLLSSCATVRKMTGGEKGNGSPTVTTAEALEPTATASEIESQLLRQVAQRIEATEADAANNQSKIIRKKPYYFKEYSNYQGKAEADDVSLSETESRTAPYVANVTLEKVRYATRLHRSREDARLDNGFLRGSGVETLSYEYRGGRWVYVGSFFQEEKTEEQVDGSWVGVQRANKPTLREEEPKKGWLGRTWSSVTGGN